MLPSYDWPRSTCIIIKPEQVSIKSHVSKSPAGKREVCAVFKIMFIYDVIALGPSLREPGWAAGR